MSSLNIVPCPHDFHIRNISFRLLLHWLICFQYHNIAWVTYVPFSPVLYPSQYYHGQLLRSSECNVAVPPNIRDTLYVCCGLLLLFIHFVFVYLASSRISFQLYSSVFISFSSLSIMLQHTRCGHFPVRLVSILSNSYSNILILLFQSGCPIFLF